MHVTFVCTGNICRSPMAEVIARARYGSDHTFDSSGVAALSGYPASDGSLEVLAEIGLDGSDHRAKDVGASVSRHDPDRIFVMTHDHLRRVTRRHPDLADRISLLDPDDLEIADPYLGDRAVYRRARDHIVRALEARFDSDEVRRDRS